MQFPEGVYIGGFVAGALSTAAAMPVCIKLCEKLDLVDDPGGRKTHSRPTPLAGGLGVFSGIVLACTVGVVVWMLHLFDTTANSRMEYGVSHRLGQLIVIASGALAMLSLGLVDDRYELSAGVKLFGQFVIGFLVAAAGIRITLFVPSLVFSYFITILWIVTLVNAFNFIDNMNGLCGGLTALASLLFALSAARRGDYLVSGLGFLFAGTLAGFLPFNFPRSQAFLGDSGSHLAGFMVSILSILPHYYSQKHQYPIAVLAPLFILAIPLLDMAQVVMFRVLRGQPFYHGDTNHISHRLVARGYTPQKAVVLIWATALLVGVIGAML